MKALSIALRLAIVIAVPIMCWLLYAAVYTALGVAS